MSVLKKKKKEPKKKKAKKKKKKEESKKEKKEEKKKRDKMKTLSKSKSARNKHRQQNDTKQKQNQKQRWGSFDDDMQKAILMSLEPVSEDLANQLASEEGDIAAQGRRLEHFERQKEQKEKREREQKQKEQRQKEQKEREKQKEQKEREKERSREAHRSRERSKQARRENQEAERRIANKVREGLVDRAVALETLRDRRAAIEIAKLNENLRAALQPGILGPFGVPKWPASGHKWPDDDDDDDDDEGEAFAFNTACQALSATGECDSRTMQRYPPTKSVCWVHEAAPASAYGSMLSSIVEFWRKRPSEKHESKTKRLYQKVFQRYMDEGRTESPISIAAKVIGACIYVWGSVSGTTRWTVYHTETGECSLSSRAPVYLVMYATSTPGRYRYARIKPHTKGTTLPGSLVH